MATDIERTLGQILRRLKQLERGRNQGLGSGVQSLDAYGLSVALDDVNSMRSTVHVTKSGTQAINGLTAISWDVEGWDSDAMWSVGVPTRLIAPIDGIYRIWGTADWESVASGTRMLGRLRKDGATVIDADETMSVTGAFMTNDVYAEYPLLATNYVEFMVQAVSTTKNVNSNSLSHFGMTWVRPIV